MLVYHNNGEISYKLKGKYNGYNNIKNGKRLEHFPGTSLHCLSTQ